MNHWTELPCMLNGEPCLLGEAKVSAMDRGFLFGDGVYEMVPVYQRRLFRVDAHLARLQHSLAAVKMASPMERDGWLALMRGLVQRLPDTDQWVYLQVTRGVAMRDHVMPQGLAPTVFAFAMPQRPVPAELRHHHDGFDETLDMRAHHLDGKLGWVFDQRLLGRDVGVHGNTDGATQRLCKGLARW